MASKDFIEVVAPSNLSDLLSEGRLAHAANYQPGTICVRDDEGVIRACDATTSLANLDTDVAMPVEILWTDTRDGYREDMGRFELDGTRTKQATLIKYPFTGDVKISEFFSSGQTVAEGSLVIKSLTTAGKADIKTQTQLRALVAATTIKAEDVERLVIGRIAGKARKAGYCRVEFTLAR